MGGRVGVGWGMQSWNRRSGDDEKRKWVGGRQGKDYEEGCVTGMAKDFANGGCSFACSFSRREIQESRLDWFWIWRVTLLFYLLTEDLIPFFHTSFPFY